MVDEDIELDYGPLVEEIPEKKKVKVRVGPICTNRFMNVRQYGVIHRHLPGFYTVPLTACWTCKLRFCQERIFRLTSLLMEEKPQSF